MKFSKSFFFLFLLFNSLNIKAQNQLKLKTTELYTLEMPLKYGDFKHQDVFMTWNIDFEKEIITYQENNKTINTFHYSSMNINQDSTDDLTIVHFNNSKENITVIIKLGNYIKIRYSTDKKPNSNPASYKTAKVYTNFIFNEYTDLFDN